MTARDWSHCHLCGAAEIREDSPCGSPTCADCWPITEHVVSMQTGAGGTSVAECRCGWRSEVAWSHRATVQETKVRLHWRDVIRRYNAEFGEGSATRELAIGAAVIALGFVNLLGIAVLFSGGAS